MNINETIISSFDEFKKMLGRVNPAARKKFINQCGEKGSTLLVQAIKNYKIPIIILLLENGADVNMKCGKNLRKLPIYYVIKYQLSDILKLLLKYNLDVTRCFEGRDKCGYKSLINISPLMYAVKVGNLDTIKLILQNTGNTNTIYDCAFDADARNYYAISPIKYLYAKWKFKFPKLYKLLIKKGGNIYEDYSPELNTDVFCHNVMYTIFGKAFSENNLQIIKWALKHKNNSIPKDVNDYHFYVYRSIKSISMFKLFMQYDMINNSKLFESVYFHSIVDSISDIYELEKCGLNLFENEENNFYKNNKKFLETRYDSNGRDIYRKLSAEVDNNFKLIMMGYYFDKKCLFYGDYLSKDMCFLILNTAKKFL